MKNRNYRNEFNYMGSKGRAVLHNETLPKFAQFFKHGDKIVEVGKHLYWDYSSYFFNPVRMCEFISIDIQRNLYDQDEPTIPLNYVVDDITVSHMADSTVDGFLFIGMYDNISDPKKALEEIYRILKPGGRVLIAFPGNGAQCGGRSASMFSWYSDVSQFIIDEVQYIYDPENNDRYAEGKNTSILVIARKPL